MTVKLGAMRAAQVKIVHQFVFRFGRSVENGVGILCVCLAKKKKNQC